MDGGVDSSGEPGLVIATSALDGVELRRLVIGGGSNELAGVLMRCVHIEYPQTRTVAIP